MSVTISASTPLADIRAHVLDLAVAGQDVAGHVHAGAAFVGVARALLEVLEAQVLGRAAHAEGLAAAVDGVGTEVDGGLQAAQVAGWSQHFGLAAAGDHGDA